MPDKLLKDGLRTSDKIGGVSEFAELLFVRLLLATCHLGRCPWNPDWIRSHALPNRHRKRLTEIAAALESLRRAHLVTRYTGPDGTAYLLIPNHGQRLSYRVRSPWPPPPEGPPDVEGQTFMALPGSPPVWEKPKALGAREHPPLFSSTSTFEPGPRAAASPPGGSAPARRTPKETESEWLARLRRDWPEVDIATELREARRKKGDRLERRWFEQHWLPGCSDRVGSTAAVGSTALEPEPEAWRQYLKDRYEGESWAESAAAYPWPQMPPQWRAKIAHEMQGRAA